MYSQWGPTRPTAQSARPTAQTLDVTEFLNVFETKTTNNRLPKPFDVGDNEDPLLTEQNDGEGTVYIIVNDIFILGVVMGGKFLNFIPHIFYDKPLQSIS